MLMLAEIHTWQVLLMEQFQSEAGQRLPATVETIFSLLKVQPIKPPAGHWSRERVAPMNLKGLSSHQPEQLSLVAIFLPHLLQGQSRFQTRTTMVLSLAFPTLVLLIGSKRSEALNTIMFGPWQSMAAIMLVQQVPSLDR